MEVFFINFSDFYTLTLENGYISAFPKATLKF